MPLTQAGVDLSARIAVRDAQEFDHPEQRPLFDRCLKSYGAPPITVAGTFHQIVQNRDHVAIVTDGPVGVRIIPLGGPPPPDALRSLEGYSTARWAGDTLIVQTTHLRGEDPAHTPGPRPLLLSRHSRITERFTRVSETELFYQFTIDDGELYTGERSRHLDAAVDRGNPVQGDRRAQFFEFACHADAVERLVRTLRPLLQSGSRWPALERKMNLYSAANG